MSWTLLIGLVLVLGLATLVVASRRRELLSSERTKREIGEARARGSHEARLQHPRIDLTRCMGCGTCVRACPEEGVLELVHGQAAVVHGARCVGHGRCARECPTDAISIVLQGLSERRDIPVLSDELEVPHVPGLFLAGEVTGHALIRTAIAHGTAVAREIARRRPARSEGRDDDELDLCIVGAGPAGIACSLAAKASGLRFTTIERDALGGTVAHYPRRKLVMTQPIDLPLAGRLKSSTYAKEELVDLWERVVRDHDLPIRTGVDFQGLAPHADGSLRVRTATGEIRARNVCLALGRRGTPRKLGVPGEELAKVSYGLVDASSYAGRAVLVVGGGDSAVEAALALSEQRGSDVTLSYRQKGFFRIKAKNEQRLEAAVAAGRIQLLLQSDVLVIEPRAVTLALAPDPCKSGGENGEGARPTLRLVNDDVFVLAGGVPPFKLLEGCGVSFDPAERSASVESGPRGTGLLRALVVALVLAVGGLSWSLAFRGYYDLDSAARPAHELHRVLRPSGEVGLALGLGAAAMVLANLAYLVRRTPALRLRVGALSTWMTIHVVTGILALLLAILHGAMDPRHTVGGHALAALAVLVCTGALGRYLYSFVPHALNGRELALEEVHARLATISAEWDQSRGAFADRVRAVVAEHVDRQRIAGFLPRRIASLVRSQLGMRRALADLAAVGRVEGVAVGEVRRLLALARRAHRVGQMAAGYEELRALLGTWRYIHRWTALGLVLLLVLHVVTAVRFGELFG